MLPINDFKIITKELGREPNLLEQGCFLNLWSEHCSYRSSAPLLKTFTTIGDRVIIGPGDDAAIVRFDDEFVLAIGMESHNHPSYVDPYNGSATGVGGIVRDIISMGARPIALMDPLYFGPLNTSKNLYLFEHIIEGISGYGNCIGVPIIRGEAFFDKSYSGNPLVNVVCIGLAKKDKIVTAKATKAGNKLVLMGSTTGRDGLGGASFASRDLSEDAESEDRPSIQVGDPFTEKLVIEATLEAIDKGLVKSCRDLGAAGLGGASSEMAAKGNLGAKIIADNVILRETNMTPYEIVIAESQERMVFEVEPNNVNAILDIAKKYDLHASEIGELTDRKYYTIEFKAQVVADIPIKLLTEGAPTFERPSEPIVRKSLKNIKPLLDVDAIKKMMLKVASSHNIASKKWIYQQYDSEVQIRTIIKPGEDAGVLKIADTKGLVVSCGCNPRHTELNPYDGGRGTIIENAMNLATKGGRGIAIVDCLNFGNPENPNIYWQFKQAILGLGDEARDLKIPVVGGNVSLYNESDEHKTAILPTPSIGMIGIVDNVCKIPSSSFNNKGDTIILVGESRDELCGSEYYSIVGAVEAGKTPTIPNNAKEIIDIICKVAEKGIVSSIKDISLGGLSAALCKSCVSIGAEIDLSFVDVGMNLDSILFSESYSRAIISTSCPDDVLDMFKGIPCKIIGVVGGNALKIKYNDLNIELSLEEIAYADESLSRLMVE